MFRHPNVIAAALLSVALVLSAVLICVFISSLNSTLEHKVMAGSTDVHFPDTISLNSGNSSVRVELQNNMSDKPVLVKVVP